MTNYTDTLTDGVQYGSWEYALFLLLVAGVVVWIAYKSK